MTVWLTSLLLGLGPNGWWIDAQLRSADDVYLHLVPMEWLDDAPESLWIAFHRREEWPMAIYLAPDAEELRWARAAPGIASSQFDRLLPQLAVPRLLLRSDVYERDEGLVAFGSLAVDSGEVLYNALLDARFDLASRRGESWISSFEQRAQEAMPRVPAEHRDEALRSAVVDFASHMLSVAGEIARQSRRHSTESFCAVLERPATLFGTWRRSLGEARFPGHWRPVDPQTGQPGDWVTTKDVLRPADQRWVVEELLRAGWTGDPAVDFAWLCSR